MRNNIFGIPKTAVFNPITRASFLSFIISIVLTYNINGQNLPDTKVSLKAINITLGEVLNILEQKTDITFSYLNEELPLKEKVTLDVENESLQQILDSLSNRYALTFIRDALRPKED